MPLRCPWYCRMTLLYSRSQHLTSLSREPENMYGCLADTASPVTCSMWPVRVSFSCPLAVSHTLMVRSAEPVTNHSFPWSNAIDRTHPKWPLMTRYSFHGACQAGRGHLEGMRRATAAEGTYACWPPPAVGTTAPPPACRTIACARCLAAAASPSDTFGMASMILAVALRDSTLAPDGTGASVSVLSAAAGAAPPAADGTASLAPGSGRLNASKAAYSSRIFV
mmetsp:Transcript_17015/g.50786  ORF Transcript_17015/g.50786 Transcript_17015/m.50786 type:complete len:223 (+) Transcript_17015:1232-1900(+)